MQVLPDSCLVRLEAQDRLTPGNSLLRVFCVYILFRNGHEGVAVDSVLR